MLLNIYLQMKRITYPENRFRICTGAVIVLLPWFAAFYLGLIFEVNDDAGNIILFREVFGLGSADSSIFVSSIFSDGLIFLYRLTDQIFWYPLLILLALGSAQLLLLHLVLNVNVSSFLRICLLVVITLTTFKLILECSFTASAILASGTALLYGVINPGANHIRATVLSILVLALGFLLRPGVFPVAMLAFVPVLGVSIFCQVTSVRKVIPYCLVMSAVVGGLYVADHAVESRTSAEFKQINTVRAKFSDSAWGDIGEDFENALSSSGWTDADYFVAKKLWWFLDEKVHSSDAIESFVATTQKSAPIPWSPTTFRSNLIRSNYAGVLFLIALLGWLAFARDSRGHEVHYTFILGLFCIVFLAGIRFPPRVAYPFFLLLALSPLVVPLKGKPDRSKFGKAHILYMSMMIPILAWTTFALVDNHRNIQVKREYLENMFESAIHNVLERYPNTLFIPLIHSGYSETKFINPFQWHELRKTVPSGWVARSPLRSPYLTSLGMDTNQPIVPQLLNNKDVIWYLYAHNADERKYILVPFLRYLNDHYGHGDGKTRLVFQIVEPNTEGEVVWLFFKIKKKY